jgi:hypothetical protein
MTPSLHLIIARLLEISTQLDTTPAEHLDTMEPLLAERAALVDQLTLFPIPLPEQHAEALEQVQQSGIRLREKLLLARAGLRNQMGQLYQSGHLLRAYSA